MHSFQWALYQMRVPDNSCAGWGCPLPCGYAGQALALNLPLNQVWEATASPTAPPTLPPTSATAATHDEGFPWWGIVLSILGAVCLLGAAAFYFMNRKKTPQKKKRSVKPAPAKPAAPETKPLVPLPQVRSVSYTAVPTPIATTAIPITTAAPITYSVPLQMPAMQAVAAPVYSSVVAPRQQTAMELFDELDVNKDGRISRQEFQRIAQERGVPL